MSKKSKRSASEKERRRKIRSEERNEKVLEWRGKVTMAASKDSLGEEIVPSDDYEYDEDYVLAEKPFMKTNTSLMTSFDAVFFEDEMSDGTPAGSGVKGTIIYI